MQFDRYSRLLLAFAVQYKFQEKKYALLPGGLLEDGSSLVTGWNVMSSQLKIQGQQLMIEKYLEKKFKKME